MPACLCVCVLKISNLRLSPQRDFHGIPACFAIKFTAYCRVLRYCSATPKVQKSTDWNIPFIDTVVVLTWVNLKFHSILCFTESLISSSTATLFFKSLLCPVFPLSFLSAWTLVFHFWTPVLLIFRKWWVMFTHILENSCPCIYDHSSIQVSDCLLQVCLDFTRWCVVSPEHGWRWTQLSLSYYYSISI